MGVKGLWQILAPVGEKQSLWELKNHTIAIDLSVWICENQLLDTWNSNLHLRNLFFRTSYLLLLGIKPIFILEGKAPVLKYDTIENRANLQGNVCPSNAPKAKICGRSRLNSTQKQCKELLNCMGISSYYSESEAEALCAILNNKGIVDGVVTQDSDCFLYGGKTIYRNFNISSNQGSVERFTLASLEKKLQLGRNKLIAMSLLCGCDYNDKGVVGIGKESALKYLSTVEESEVLTRFSMWKHDFHIPNSKLEASLKQKALQNPLFPFENVQKEFLENEMDISGITFNWKQPNIRNFVIFAERKLGWNVDYAMEKFLPVVARWHLVFDTKNVIEIERILKKRNLRSVFSYEVKWKNFSSTTIEPKSILETKYSALIEEFNRVVTHKKSKKGSEKTKNKIEGNVDEITEQLEVMKMDDFPAIESCKSFEDSLSVSDFDCSATNLLELSSIVESITNNKIV